MKFIIKNIFAGILTILALMSAPMVGAFDTGIPSVVDNVQTVIVTAILPTKVSVANTSHLTNLLTTTDNIEVSGYDAFDPCFAVLSAGTVNTELTMLKGVSVQPGSRDRFFGISKVDVNKTGPPTGIPILFRS